MKIISLLILTMALFILSSNPPSAKEPLLPGAEDLARRMIQGVDIVKLILYKVLSEDYSKTNKYKDMDFCKDLAAAAVNEIFNNHNEKTLRFFNKNKETVVNGIINLGEKHPDLKRPITDSIRVFVQANLMLTNDPKYYSDSQIFQNAIDRGIFIKGGDHPEPTSFLKMVDDFAKKYNIH